MDERDLRRMLNDAAGDFRFRLEGSDRVLRRTKRRILRIQAIAAVLAIGVIFAVTTVLVRQESRGIPPQPVGPAPTKDLTGITGIGKGFVDTINSCERRILSRDEVASILKFQPEEPSPWERRFVAEFSKKQLERMGGIVVGCNYSAIDRIDDPGSIVISAYLGAEPPRPLDRTKPAEGAVGYLGDEASFSPFGNGDRHLGAGPEGATSVLEIRSGELILRFNAGVAADVGMTGANYLQLRQLAERALTNIHEGTCANGRFLDFEVGDSGRMCPQ